MASLTTQQIAAADFSHDPSVEHSPSVDKPTSFDGVTLTFHWVTVMLGRVVYNRDLARAVTRRRAQSHAPAHP